MVTLTTANNALKEVYVGVVANQLNINANPLLAQIKRSNKDIWGKEIVKMTTYGINGGVGAGEEAGELPVATGNNYAQIRASLKNLYGQRFAQSVQMVVAFGKERTLLWVRMVRLKLK